MERRVDRRELLGRGVWALGGLAEIFLGFTAEMA
jgi:hypothetical protein